MVAASRGLSGRKRAAPAVEGGRRQHPPRLLSVNVAARTIPITTAPTYDDICSSRHFPKGVHLAQAASEVSFGQTCRTPPLVIPEHSPRRADECVEPHARSKADAS
jgi:hypothetical protein